MLFRAEIEDHGDYRVVRLSGALHGEMSAELTRLVAGATPPLRLDLADLVSADGTGLRALESLESQGAEVVGASPYVALQRQSALDRQGPRGQSHGRVTTLAKKPGRHAREKGDR